MTRPNPLVVAFLLFIFLAACGLGGGDRTPDPTPPPAVSDPATGVKRASGPMGIAAPSDPSVNPADSGDGSDSGGDFDDIIGSDIDIGSDAFPEGVASHEVRPILDVYSIESFRQRFRLTTSGSAYALAPEESLPIPAVDIAYTRRPGERFAVAMQVPTAVSSAGRVGYIEADGRVFVQIDDGPWVEPGETLPIDPRELIEKLDAMESELDFLEVAGEETVNGRRALHLTSDPSMNWLDPANLEGSGLTSVTAVAFDLWIDIDESFILKVETTIFGEGPDAFGMTSPGEISYAYERYDINSSVVIDLPETSVASSDSLVEIEGVVPAYGELDPSHQGGVAFTVRGVSLQTVYDDLNAALLSNGFVYMSDESIPEINAYTYRRGNERLFLSMDDANPNSIWVSISVYMD